MEWASEGVIVSLRKHGETSAIIEVLTQSKGRHAGVVRGGASRKKTPDLQPGTFVSVEWRARLEEHLGTYSVEPLHSRAAVLSDRLGLAGLSAVMALVCYSFPERMALPALYDSTLALMTKIEERGAWLSDYALWEMQLLDDLGYGLDLSACAATGTVEDLVFVSPKSGRAVSDAGAGEWRTQMLALPSFLREGSASSDLDEIRKALRLTGYFLQSWLAPALGDKPLPEARARLVTMLDKSRR